MKSFTLSTSAVATAAASANAAIGIWNTNNSPIAIKKIVGYVNAHGQSDACPMRVQRTTTRGTQGTTVAIVASNLHAADRGTFTHTGINLDTNYSAQPTLEAGRLGEANVDQEFIPEIIFDFECDPVWIASGQGLAIVSDSAIGIYASRWAFFGEL